MSRDEKECDSSRHGLRFTCNGLRTMSVETGPSGLIAASAGGEMSAGVYDDGRLRVEHDSYYAACDGELLRLPLKEFLILSRLARSAGHVVVSEELRRHAWRDAAVFHPTSLHAQVYRLRRRLRPFGLRIETMVNVGYRLVPGGGAD